MGGGVEIEGIGREKGEYIWREGGEEGSMGEIVGNMRYGREGGEERGERERER
jgi:hypothetical protein